MTSSPSRFFASLDMPSQQERMLGMAWWRPAALVALFYTAFAIAGLVLHGGDPMWFVWAGERYSNLDPNGRLGYDGQFVYYIATEWLGSLPRLDTPPYRLQRILLAAMVRLLSLSDPALVPWLIVGVNIAAMVVGTWVPARWLAGHAQGVSPWWALTYGLFVGQVMAFSRDLTEPLAYALTAVGVCAWLEGRRWSPVLAFALAGLSRETTVLFPAALLIAGALRRDWHVWPLALSFVPIVVWEAVLFAWFGSPAFTLAPKPVLFPLSGILPNLTAEPGRVSALLVVAIPGTALLLWSGRRLLRVPGCAAYWLVTLNALPVLFYPQAVYDHLMHAGRNIAGLVLACVIAARPLGFGGRLTLAAAWVGPTLTWVIPMLRWAPWDATR